MYISSELRRKSSERIWISHTLTRHRTIWPRPLNASDPGKPECDLIPGWLWKGSSKLERDGEVMSVIKLGREETGTAHGKSEQASMLYVPTSSHKHTFPKLWIRADCRLSASLTGLTEERKETKRFVIKDSSSYNKR